ESSECLRKKFSNRSNQLEDALAEEEEMICLSVNKLDFDVNSGVSLFASIHVTIKNVRLLCLIINLISILFKN
ncbi:hypothetical protein BpHYR1_018118, partial [Brachionus plicatilis]